MFSSSDRSSASEVVWISDCQRICGDHAEHLCQPLLLQQWLPLGARVLVLGEERVHPGSEQSQLRLYAQGFPSRNSGPKPESDRHWESPGSSPFFSDPPPVKVIATSTHLCLSQIHFSHQSQWVHTDFTRSLPHKDTPSKPQEVIYFT